MDGGGDMGGSDGFGSIGDFNAPADEGVLGMFGISPESFAGVPATSDYGDVLGMFGVSPEAATAFGDTAPDNGTPSGFTGLGGFSGAGTSSPLATLLSIIGKNALGKMGIPGPVAGILSGIASGKSPGQSLSSSVFGTIGTLMGMPAGPLGAFAGGQLGSMFGGQMAGAPGAGQGMAPGNIGTVGSSGNWMDLLSGGLGLWNAMRLSQLGGLTGPQSAARGQLQAMLGGGDLSNLPGYKAGEQAVTRSMAANGYLGSGNMMTALKNYSGDFYAKQLAALGGLAQPTPDQAAYNIGSTQLQGEALNRLLYGMRGISLPSLPAPSGTEGP